MTLTQGDAVNAKVVAIAASTFLLAVISRKLVRRYRLPQMDMLAVLIVVAFAVWFAGWTLPGSDGKTAIAIAGNVPAGLPTPHIPHIQLGWVPASRPRRPSRSPFSDCWRSLAIAQINRQRNPADPRL